jgi:hypothetical protein
MGGRRDFAGNPRSANGALWPRLQVKLKLGAPSAELNHIARYDAGSPQYPLPVDISPVAAVQIGYAEQSRIGWVLSYSGMLAANQVVPVWIIFDRIGRVSANGELFEVIEREFLYLITL